MESTQSRSLGELLSPGDTSMVATMHDGRMSSRPLTVSRIDDDAIDILIDRTAEWARPLTASFATHVTVTDSRKNEWVSMNGTGAISDDRGLIDELWNPFAGAFFEDGQDTPGVAVLRITVTDGEYWSTPSGRLGSLFTMLKAKVGRAERVGERGTVET